MQLLLLALALVAPASGFVPARARAARAAPSRAASADAPAARGALNGWVPDASAFAWGLPGSLAPVPLFDPFDLAAGATVEEVKLWREAEVTHGRVAMLATVGFLAQEQAHFLFVEPAKDIGPAIRHLDEVRAVNPAFFEGLTFAIACAELYRALYGWVSPQAPPARPTREYGGVGRPRMLKADYYPGDVGFDPLGLKPATADGFAEMATKELQHGRLAMLASAGFLAQELVNEQPIWANLVAQAKPDL